MIDDRTTSSEHFSQTFRLSVLLEKQLRLPSIVQHDGVDVIRFDSSWQFKLLLDPHFIEQISQFIETREKPYRLILQLDAIEEMSMADLGNLLAVFAPLAEDEGVICLCHLQPEVRQLIRVHLLECLFVVCHDLQSAIKAVKEYSE